MYHPTFVAVSDGFGVPSGGRKSLLSAAYKWVASPHCLRLFRQAIAWAFSLAFPNAGSSIAAKIAMMAITTSNSIRVKPTVRVTFFWELHFKSRIEFV